MKLQLLQALAAANGAPQAVRATMSITTIAKANIVDGEGFTLHDYWGKPYFFEFDTNGVVAAGSIRVDISADVTADNVRDRIVSTINALAGQLGFSSASGGAATVTNTQDFPGAEGNKGGNSDTVVDAGFVVSQWAGGAMSGVPLRAVLGKTKSAALWIHSVGASGVASIAYGRLWGYSNAGPARARKFAPLGTGTDADKGKINGGDPLGETSADQISHVEIVDNLDKLDWIYLELGAFTTAGNVDAWLEANEP